MQGLGFGVSARVLEASGFRCVGVEGSRTFGFVAFGCRCYGLVEFTDILVDSLWLECFRGLKATRLQGCR